MNVDLAPTFLEIAGINKPAHNAGIFICRYFKGEKSANGSV
jgi:hypothetical protein